VLSQTRVGPIPHPAILQKYDEIHPGAVAIILGIRLKKSMNVLYASETKVKTVFRVIDGLLYKDSDGRCLPRILKLLLCFLMLEIDSKPSCLETTRKPMCGRILDVGNREKIAPNKSKDLESEKNEKSRYCLPACGLLNR